MMSHKPQTLILYDSDTLYAERFLRCVNGRSQFPLRAVSVHSPEELRSRMAEPPGGVLLLAEALLPTLPRDAVGDSWNVCLLCEKSPRPSDPYPGIRRYQPVSELLSELLSLVSVPSAVLPDGAGDAWILGVCSPSATSLAGAVSWLCARILAERRSVLYVTLENFFPVPGGMDSHREQGLSDLLFRRSHSPGHFWSPDLALRRDGLPYLAPAVNPEDIWQLSSRELGLLPREILQQSEAEVLVVHFPCGRDPRPFLSVCRHILLPAENTPDSRQALQSFREYLTLQEQDELLSRTRELILPPCPELASLSAADPLLRHTPLGHMVEEELHHMLAD